MDIREMEKRVDMSKADMSKALDTRTALVCAVEMIKSADQNFYAQDRVLATLHCLLAQHGCEHMDPAGDGYLTTACDIAMFG